MNGCDKCGEVYIFCTKLCGFQDLALDALVYCYRRKSSLQEGPNCFASLLTEIEQRNIYRVFEDVVCRGFNVGRPLGRTQLLPRCR